MRAPEELDEVNWAGLEHAYGPADDVPAMIRALYAEADPQTEEGEVIGEELINNLNHQGSVYPATLEAVPFLAHLVLHVDWHRADLLHVLTSLAEPDEWGEPAPESLGGRVRRAVLAELPHLMGCLIDPDFLVRQAAIRMACIAESPTDPATVRTLVHLYENDPSAQTRADALTALALLDPDPANTQARETTALGDRDPEVRLAAAMQGLDRAQPPYPAPLVAVVAADGAAAPDSHRATARPQPFPCPGAPRDREDEILTEDPEGALNVARAWIASGDTHSWGTHLVRHVDQRWRDRAAQCVSTLAEALPLHPGGTDRFWIVREIANLMPRVGDPGRHVRDLLLTEATSDEQERAIGLAAAPGAYDERVRGTGHGLMGIATGESDRAAYRAGAAAADAAGGGGAVDPRSAWRQRMSRTNVLARRAAVLENAARARLALARCGDLRLFDRPDALTGAVAAALLTHHRAKALPCLRPLLPDLIARGDTLLLDALGPELAAAHLPQLKLALREHPTVACVRLLGQLGPSGTDAETADLLADLGPKTRHDIRAEAATSHAVITGNAGPALVVLRDLLNTQSPHDILPAIGRLGPPAVLLAPHVSAVLNGPQYYGRAEAADAYWRITSGPQPVLPVLLGWAAPTLTYAPDDAAWYARRDALSILADMRAAGLVATPRQLHPLLELCATSPRRVTRRDDDEELRRLARTLLDQPVQPHVP